MIAAGILGAEVTFWIVLGVALACRYLFRMRRLSKTLLLLLPMIDLCLLLFVTADLALGAKPRQPHAFAASYLGFTVAFGRSITRWADRRFAYRFAGGAPPPRLDKGTAAYVRHLWGEWLRVVLAAGMSAMILLGLATLIRPQPIPDSLDTAAQNPLWAQMILLGMVVVIWFLAGPAFARITDNRDSPKPDSHR